MATAAKKKPATNLTVAEKAEVFDLLAPLEDRIREGEAEMENIKANFKGVKEKVNGLKADLRQQLWEAAHPEATPLYSAAAARTQTTREERNPPDDSNQEKTDDENGREKTEEGRQIRAGEADMENIKAKFKGVKEKVKGLKDDLRQQLWEAAAIQIALQTTETEKKGSKKGSKK